MSDDTRTNVQEKRLARVIWRILKFAASLIEKEYKLKDKER